jgi:hypothetical protein
LLEHVGDAANLVVQSAVIVGGDCVRAESNERGFGAPPRKGFHEFSERREPRGHCLEVYSLGPRNNGHCGHERGTPNVSCFYHEFLQDSGFWR